jgi:hypothetical protein
MSAQRPWCGRYRFNHVLATNQANHICLRDAAVGGKPQNARAAAPFHLISEFTEAAENAEKIRIAPA